TDPVSGCSNSCIFKITVDVVISINENEIAKIGVYPNPNNGKFNISFDNINGKVVYQIYDTKGSLIAAENIYTDGNTIEEVSLNLIPGVYFVKVVTTNQSYVEKLVIE
ncbi:MAG: T9SS type A sorting domain-containing protein, partial [Candidatus Izemoplasmatales bacterium]